MARRLTAWIVILTLLVGCETSLRDDLTESQADDIVALLHQEGVASRKKRNEKGDWSIVVDHGAEDGAKQLLHLYGAPRSAHPTVAEMFPGTGLLPSEVEEHARYQYALGHDLASTIEQIDGVLASRVHVAMPRHNPRSRERQTPTASVFVRYRSDQRVDLMKGQIRTLVAQALPGADPADVSVMSVPVFPPAGASHPRAGRNGADGDPQTDRSMRSVLLQMLPWVLLAATVCWIGWRVDVHRAAHAWMDSVKTRRSTSSRRRRRRPDRTPERSGHE